MSLDYDIDLLCLAIVPPLAGNASVFCEYGSLGGKSFLAYYSTASSLGLSVTCYVLYAVIAPFKNACSSCFSFSV